MRTALAHHIVARAAGIVFVLGLLGGRPAAAALDATGPLLNRPDAPLQLHLLAELGSRQVLSNVIRFGSDGTRFAYTTEGGQGTLGLQARLAAALHLAERHLVVLLWQPLSTASQQVATRPLRFGTVDFAAGTPLRVHYGFDAFRVSYAYDLLAGPAQRLAVGGAVQIRNANVDFTANDGSRAFVESNFGAVPLLRVVGRLWLPAGWHVGIEADGIYSPIPDGSDTGVGALLDAALRGGTALRDGVEAFVSVRYIGGGFRGRVDGVPALLGGTQDSENWLHLLAVAVGLELF